HECLIEKSGQQQDQYRVHQRKNDDDGRKAFPYRQHDVEYLDKNQTRNDRRDRKYPGLLKVDNRPDPTICQHNRERDECIHLDELWKLASQPPYRRLLDKIETSTCNHACNKAAEMCLPVNTRSADGYHDVQSDVDDKEIPWQADLS